MKSFKDVTGDDGSSEVSLVKLAGSGIKDVTGYLSAEAGFTTMAVLKVAFEDGTSVKVQGIMDEAYLVWNDNAPRDIADDATMDRLYAEQQEAA